MKNGLISIIIPTYNGEKYIRDCISSIQMQNVKSEIIVVDDVSNDNTVRIAKEMGAIVFVNDVRKGQVAGKNTGIRHMNGEFFVTIDQDDRLKSNALFELLNALKGSHSRIVLSRLEDFAEREEDIQYCHTEPFRGILTGAAIIKKEVFNTIGYFDESVLTGEVIDLIFRCKKYGIKIHYSDIITCERRIHGENYGRTNQLDEYRDYSAILRKHFLERIE